MLETLQTGSSAARVWDFDHPSYTEKLRAISRLLGIGGPDTTSQPLVPYQLRHSGASIDMNDRLRSPLEIQTGGRWASAKSLTRYGRGLAWPR